MPIKYVVQEMKRRNRETNLVDVSYFARPKYDGVTSQGDLAYLVSQISAVSVGDVLSVLNTTSMLMASELSNGRIVDMGDLGRFRLSIRSESAPQRELFVADNIRGNHVIYVPGPQIRRKLISPVISESRREACLCRSIRRARGRARRTRIRPVFDLPSPKSFQTRGRSVVVAPTSGGPVQRATVSPDQSLLPLLL